MSVTTRIPVYLVTGFLGSGKTTLLANWLREPLLANAITVVNEYGEVGLDDRLLAAATDLPNRLAGGCMCCTGLSGLAETLEELFWARLHREIAPFACVVIETTGLAEPEPILRSFDEGLLQERFIVQATIATIAATAGESILSRHQTARVQVEGADRVVLTKTDLVSSAACDALAAAVDRLRPGMPVLRSARGELALSQVMSAAGRDAPAHRPARAHDGHDHLDGVTTRFIAVDRPMDDQAAAAFARELQSTYGASLLRAKGLLPRVQGGHFMLQLSPTESHFDLAPWQAPATASDLPPGMTIILNSPDAPPR